MIVRGALLAMAVTACSSSRPEVKPVGNTAGTAAVGAGSSARQIVLGDALEVAGTTIAEGFKVVSSDSLPWDREDIGVELSCHGETGTRCEVEGMRIVPRNVGTYEVTMKWEGTPKTWTVTVVEADGIEIAPCGELTVDATHENDGGVAIVAPTLVVRTKQGTRLPALGATINDKPIDDPSFYSLRATTTPSTHTVRGRYRQFVTACRVTIVARPMKT